MSPILIINSHYPQNHGWATVNSLLGNRDFTIAQQRFERFRTNMTKKMRESFQFPSSV